MEEIFLQVSETYRPTLTKAHCLANWPTKNAPKWNHHCSWSHIEWFNYQKVMAVRWGWGRSNFDKLLLKKDCLDLGHCKLSTVYTKVTLEKLLFPVEETIFKFWQLCQIGILRMSFGGGTGILWRGNQFWKSYLQQSRHILHSVEIVEIYAHIFSTKLSRKQRFYYRRYERVDFTK